ncbi:unnamed protein product [Cladocopium goreaui]|uniref:PPPDE domain-containing protein n=1 Tax=Cladocopium goreaui TaxID=2562237 RepID=A0A9P1CB53_9DINO|nr:unnamed protein product [Cladocopium goreaui]
MALLRPRSATELRRPRPTGQRKTLPLPLSGEMPSKIQLPKCSKVPKVDLKGPRHHATLAPKAEVLKVAGVEGWKDSSTYRIRETPEVPEVVTPKQRVPASLTDAAVRPRCVVSREVDNGDATTREAVPLPGLTELQKSHVVLERWSCFPQLPSELHPSRATALRLHKALREPQAQVAIDLLGHVDAESRHLLLMWCLGCCLELLGFLENAAALFAKCTSMDVGNPVHAYNRGVVLLRLHQWQAASRDFDLAASHCLQKGWLLPAMLLARRALANLQLQKLPQVWADFELARLRTRFPNFTLGQLQRQMAREELSSYASYRRALTGPPVMRFAAHRHWVVQALAGEKLQAASEAVQQSLLELLRAVPGFAQVQFGCVPWDAVSIVLLRGGQPLLPTYSHVYILFSGELRVLRFVAALGAGRQNLEEGRVLGVPEALLARPFLEEERVLSVPSSFCGQQGRHQDGWLVASGHGAGLLQITVQGMQRM